MGDLKEKARLKGLMGPHDGCGDIVSDAAEAGLVLSEPVYMHALANDELQDLLEAELGKNPRKRAVKPSAKK